MKKVVLTLGMTCLLLAGLSGCSSTPKQAAVQTTEKFNLGNISLTVNQFVTPEIVYHSHDEIKDLVVAGIKSNLKQADLITTDTTMNSLDIVMIYNRRFVGDATAIPSDSLAYPIYDYEIKVKDGDKLLTTISRKNLVFNGGFAMNLKLMGGLLRDKSDETVFIEALSKTVAKSIQELKENN
ncbi:hypothetical protein [Shewanella sp. SR44-3]|uniref:hypothetical protein n=1 Tax=unclassified Shewanella TaxID=196818 RepID=UPI0015F79788|nr:hypothetical protein [Shewanella sp. SR44-3]MBB1269117.1 hypothetical protein [Shewanella sp. SR44-3]